MTRHTLEQAKAIRKEAKAVNDLLESYDKEHSYFNAMSADAVMSRSKTKKGSSVEQYLEKKSKYIDMLIDLKNQLIDTEHDILSFIKIIPDSYMRTLVELHCLKGLSWIQIATRLGTTESSIKMYFARNIGCYIDQYNKQEDEKTPCP